MRTTPLVEGEYYHLYNRGVDKRTVFTDPGEYKRFLAYLYMLNSHRDDIRPSDFFRTHTVQDAFGIKRGNCLVALGAYCLMQNHFHLYATPLVENGISKFMQRLQTAYTKYFNEKHKRTGSLFGCTFKSQHISTDRQAKYLFSYIHLNPAKLVDPVWKERGPRDWKKLLIFIEKYPYSSYTEYLSNQYNIIEPSHFPSYLKNRKEKANHITDWLQYQESA
ncbi:transposase [Patescibacteria group bacterium]|nr:transposase [Patescibacteria group bacterium]